MRYQDAVRIHGENTSQYWRCIPGCTNCCPMGREQEILAPATLFDVWRGYALRNPGREPFQQFASRRFGLHAIRAGSVLDSPEIYGLEPDKFYFTFSRQNPCENLNEDATGCVVHGTVAMGPGCLAMPEFDIGDGKSPGRRVYEKQEFCPCIAGKTLPHQERERINRISHIGQHEMGLSMRAMPEISIRGVNASYSVVETPDLAEEVLYRVQPEKQLGGMLLATTQALARIIGQSTLEGELWFNGITPLEEKYIDGFLRTLP